MPKNTQPRFESHPESLEKGLIITGVFLLAALFWAGGAFNQAPFVGAPKGTWEAAVGRFLAWDHRALTRVVLVPFANRPLLFILAASAVVFSPVLYGLSRNLWKDRGEALYWALSFIFVLGLAFLLPMWLLSEALSPFAYIWWRMTVLFGLAGFDRQPLNSHDSSMTATSFAATEKCPVIII